MSFQKTGNAPIIGPVPTPKNDDDKNNSENKEGSHKDDKSNKSKK